MNGPQCGWVGGSVCTVCICRLARTGATRLPPSPPTHLPTCQAGKSLTAHEVLRQCWRSSPAASDAAQGGAAERTAAAAAAAGGGGPEGLQGPPPPALVSINCMSMTSPQQVGLVNQL